MTTAVDTVGDTAVIESELSLRFGISFTYACSIVKIIRTLKTLGISEQDILTGDSDYFDTVYATHKDELNGATKRDTKRAVAYYRRYHNISADDVVSHITNPRNPYRIVLTEEYMKEREEFLSWFYAHYTSRERGQSFYRDICKIRESGITDEMLLNEDERNVCDRHFSLMGKEMSRSMIKEYRQAVRLYRTFRGVADVS